jgi:hypothetical protein
LPAANGGFIVLAMFSAAATAINRIRFGFHRA